ncbi:MAG TPA: hypothetical protein VGR26_11550 [Acidimicrobiales bacterium]|nr:hypothetical protein [Acidimicrobiales bacterium]
MGSPLPKVHYQDGSDRFLGRQDSPVLYARSICGIAWTLDRVTRDRNAVTCRTCQRGMDVTPEDRHVAFDARRRKQARRREAQRIVLERHAEEVEMELAVLVLGDLG